VKKVGIGIRERRRRVLNPAKTENFRRSRIRGIKCLQCCPLFCFLASYSAKIVQLFPLSMGCASSTANKPVRPLPPVHKTTEKTESADETAMMEESGMFRPDGSGHSAFKPSGSIRLVPAEEPAPRREQSSKYVADENPWTTEFNLPGAPDAGDDWSHGGGDEKDDA